MAVLETRLKKLEAQLSAMTDGPTLADLLRARLREARARPPSAQPRPLPEGDDPLTRRLREALIRAQEARARVQDGTPGPW
jgi:hypothetical protein